MAFLERHNNIGNPNRMSFGPIFICVVSFFLVQITSANIENAKFRLSRALRNNFFENQIPSKLCRRAVAHLKTRESAVRLCSERKEKRKRSHINGVGIYYGISEEFLKVNRKEDEKISPDNHALSTPDNRPTRKKNSSEDVSIGSILSDTISEFRATSEELRDTLDAIREEIAEISRTQKQMLQQQNSDTMIKGGNELPLKDTLTSQRNRKKQFERLAKEIENWANQLLFEEGAEEDGWKAIECSGLLKNKFNKDGKIKCYLKWLPDSRVEHAVNIDETNLYPCIRCYTTIDAPLEHVCNYLSDASRIGEYNDLVVKHNDLEEITPGSKICWGQCPQILFIKPRDFVTFCYHKWKRDGTQVIVNQAVEHENAPAVLEEGKSNACRAYAIRGGNFLSHDPNDPGKTRIAIIAHGDPGGGLPHWACKAAVNAVVAIEPFKLFYKIENGVKKTKYDESKAKSVTTSGRSTQPGGLSQLGYACFWPNGGGSVEFRDNEDTGVGDTRNSEELNGDFYN